MKIRRFEIERFSEPQLVKIHRLPHLILQIFKKKPISSYLIILRNIRFHEKSRTPDNDSKDFKIFKMISTISVRRIPDLRSS